MPDTETQSTYVFGDFRLSPEKRALQDREGQNISLRGKVFDLLWYLVRHRGRLVDKTELLEAVWPDTVVEENNLNQAVSALRQALGDDARTPRYIATIKGRGYQFVGEVSLESSAVGAKMDTAVNTRNWLPLVAASFIAIAIVVWANLQKEPPVPASPVIERFADATLSIVTDYAGSHSNPALSPDGRMMAYVSDVGGTPQIWVKNLQRGDPLQITHGPYPARSPTWSPDEDQILFDRTGPDGTSIYSVGTMGQPEATMVVEHAIAPNYAKRTNAFVYSTGRQVWLAQNDGRDREKIIGIPSGQGFAGREPALSPDGKLVAFIHADEGPLGNLWVIPSEGGEARQLTTLETGGGIAGAPEWSGDGKYIVYSTEANTGGGHLWRIDAESGEVAKLTTGTSGANDATISSNGSRLAYTATRAMWRLTRVDAETAETSTIFESRTPIFLPIASPDGQKIVFFTRNPTGMQIVTIDSDGDNLRQLTFDEAGENALPTWTGDGDAILYYRGRALHRLSPTDGSDTQVFADFHWSSHNWLTAHGNRISYHNIDRPNDQHRTVVRELGESTEIELPVPIEAAQWTANGKELIGWLRQTGELLICRPGAESCRNIESDGKNVTGAWPKWSNDGQQIYFLRGTDEGECCTLWRIDIDGASQTRIADLTGFESDNSYYGVDATGDIFYNHLDRSTGEIWLAEIDD